MSSDQKNGQPALRRLARRIRFLPGVAIIALSMSSTGCFSLQITKNVGDAQDHSTAPAGGAHLSRSATTSHVDQVSYDDPISGPHGELFTTDINFDEGVSLEQALEYTLNRHPLLQASRHDVEAARARLVTAGLLPNPRLVLDTSSPIDEKGPTDLGGRLEFTILTGGKRHLREAVAKAEIERANIALDEQVELAMTATAEAALEVLYLQELAVLQQQFSELTAVGAQAQKQLVEQGVITEVAGLASEIDAADAEFDRLDTATQLAAAQIRLAETIGRTPPEPVRMRGELILEPVPPVELQVVLAAAREARPELAGAETDVLRTRRELDLARADARPDFEIAPRFQETFNDPDDTFGGRFGMDVPLFDANQGVIGEIAARLRGARALAGVAELTTQSEVASAYIQLAPIQARLVYYDTQIAPLAERAEAAIARSEAASVIDPYEASRQMRSLAQARINELNLRYLHTRLRTQLELLLGTTLDNLAASNAWSTPETLPSGPVFELPAPNAPPRP